MGTVTFLAPANPQWVWLELKTMGVLRRLHFGPVVRLTRVDRRYEVTCLRTGASKRTTELGRAAALIRVRWSAGVHTHPQSSMRDKAS